MSASGFANRVAGHLSRRFERPELLAVIDPGARTALRDDIAGGALVAGLLGADDVFVDVGSNEGQWLEAATRCAPSAQHVAFEPIPDLARVIESRFQNVEVRQVALSDSSGDAVFNYFPSLSGFSGLQRRNDVPGESREIAVRRAKLDDEYGGPVRVLKIDVEGGELPVLKGAEKTLARSRPAIIFEHQPAPARLYGATSALLWTFLAEREYRIFDLLGNGPMALDEFANRAAGGVVNWLAQPA